MLDFGVAKLQAMSEMSAATRTGTILGTVAYMSPEQARGDKIVNHRADVYTLGAILYELCSGQRPHPGDSNNAILHHISTHPAVPLESVQPGLPAGLVDLVAGALSSDPGRRPASAEAFAQALAVFVEARGLASAVGRGVRPVARRAHLHAARPGRGRTAHAAGFQPRGCDRQRPSAHAVASRASAPARAARGCHGRGSRRPRDRHRPRQQEIDGGTPVVSRRGATDGGPEPPFLGAAGPDADRTEGSHRARRCAPAAPSRGRFAGVS